MKQERMEAQVIASNLARLRAESGLSQAKLAEKSGVSRLTLGKIERGEVAPRAETLSELADGLKVPLADLVAPVRPLAGVRFRAQKRVNTREQVLAHVSGWLHAYNELEDDLNQCRSFALENVVGTKLTPQQLAAEARRQFKLSDTEAIRDVCGLLEDHGIKVLLLKRSNNVFFGLSVSKEGGGPAIVVNTWERISVERWIFTAAHELGHLLLHTDSYDRTKDAEDDSQEREADRFASCFLMPEETFRSEWEETAGLRLLDRVLKVKRIFRVSYKTVLHRLVESGTLPQQAWRAFQMQHKDAFGTTLRKTDEPKRLLQGEFRLDWNSAGEPFGLSPYDFCEDRLSRLVRQALEREVISQGRAAEILGISRTEIRELAAEWKK